MSKENYRHIPGNNWYKINLNKDIINKNGNDVKKEIANGKIYIDIYGTRKEVEIEWLRNIAFYELEMPVDSYNKIWDVQFKPDGNPFRRDKVKVIPVLPDGIEWIPGYKMIPTNPSYGLHESGIIYSVKTGNYIRPTSREYSSVKLYNPVTQVSVNLLLHRLKAITFIPNDDYETKWLVNHLDGKPDNHAVNNLEWCTPSRNNQHAVDNHLRKDNMACKVRNYKTGSIAEFPSVKSACKYMGVDERYTYSAMTGTPGKLINGLYEIRKDSDDRPFFYIDDNHDKLKIDFYLGSDLLKSLDTVIAAAKSLLPTYRSVDTKTRLMRLVTAKFPNHRLSITGVTKTESKGVQAKHMSTGEVVTADRIVELSNLLNINRRTIAGALHKNNYRVVNDYVYRRYSEEPWDTSKYVYSKKSNPISVICKKGDVEETCSSYREAMRLTGVDKKLIRKAIETQNTNKGWLFKDNPISSLTR